MATQTIATQDEQATPGLAESECAEAIEGVQRGLEAMKAGRTRPIREFLAELREEFGFPEKRPETE